jgi:TIR domain
MKDNRSRDDAEVYGRYKLTKVPTMAESVFISYSSADSDVIQPVFRLLCATVGSVFLDTLGIRPGKKWKEEIAASIRECDLLLLFWCKHSKASKNVKSEYELAIKLEKDVMPVCFDSTPLTRKLSQYQAVDFSAVAWLNHEGKGHGAKGGLQYANAGELQANGTIRRGRTMASRIIARGMIAELVHHGCLSEREVDYDALEHLPIDLRPRRASTVSKRVSRKDVPVKPRP